eukprot:TRINITY_DN8744_c0_g1_i2.p1 TRINITY_DN8744_c0_g1~~TRINITY_DN8744_c0_g1_i2.p1  ORF type:complete len:149 (-),score=23.87 TRINITY_DN8744_c0_g1_i2:294-716(-)
MGSITPASQLPSIMTGELLLLILICVCLVECAPRRRGGFKFSGGGRGGGGGGGGIEWWQVWIILFVSATVLAAITFTIKFVCCNGSFKSDKPMEERHLTSWADVRISIFHRLPFVHWSLASCWHSLRLLPLLLWEGGTKD